MYMQHACHMQHVATDLVVLHVDLSEVGMTL